MKLATFNTNSIRSRLPIVLDWLQANQPDFLCIQETKVVDELFPVEAIREVGYVSTFRGEKSYNGVAILSKHAPDRVQFGFDDGGPADGARLMVCHFGELALLNTYVPQGRELDHVMFLYKQEWYRRLHRFFAKHFRADAPVVWVGDLNVAPTPMDVHNPQDQADHVCFHADIRRVFADTLAWGFEDVVRKHHPEPGLFSYFDYRTPNAVARKMGWRIDHILATSPMAARCSAAWVDLEPRLREKPSDHTVVVAEFAD